MIQTSSILDPGIRNILFGGCSGIHTNDTGELVIHELGLAHAKRRVDVTVIGDEFHGYEIKSERDRLDRLKGQMKIYAQALHRLTLIVATKHLKSTIEMIPAWCGLKEVQVDLRGQIVLRDVRRAERNPSVDPFILAHLLWRSEVIDILSNYDTRPASLRASRTKLYKLLVEKVSEDELTRLIKIAMVNREHWRVDLPPLKYDD